MKSLVFLACLLLASPLAQAVDRYDRGDAWEYHQLGQVSASSAWRNSNGATFDPRDMFGGLFSDQEPGVGHFAFGDYQGRTTLVTNVVEFEALRFVPLVGYKMALGADFGPLRTSSKIILYYFNRGTSQWVKLDEFMPLYTSVANPNHYGPVSENTRTLPGMVVAKRFKIEVVNNVDNLGPRVIEIDSVTAPNPDDPFLEVTSPAEGTVYNTPAEIPIVYNSSDQNEIDSVEIYGNDILLYVGGATGSYTWTNSVSGSHSIKVKALDKIGGETIQSVNVRVIDPSSSQILLTNLRVTETEYAFDLSGYNPGNAVTIFASPDLVNWTEITSEFPPEPTWTFTEPNSGDPVRFYRAMEKL